MKNLLFSLAAFGVLAIAPLSASAAHPAKLAPNQKHDPQKMTHYVCDGNTRGYSTILGSVEIDGVVYKVLEDSDTKEVTAVVESGRKF